MPIRPVLSRRLAGAAILLTALAPRLAHAHAILEESQPEPGGSIPAGTVALRLRFNSRIDLTRSRLLLTAPDRTQTTLTILQGGPPDIVGANLELKPGAYAVRWQVLAIDGHITRGDVPFTVTEH